MDKKPDYIRDWEANRARWLAEHGSQDAFDEADFTGKTIQAMDWMDVTERGIIKITFTDGSSFTVCGNDLGSWIHAKRPTK